MGAAYDLEPAFADVLPLLSSGLRDDDPLFSPLRRVVDSARRLAAAEDVRARLTTAALFRSVNPEITGTHEGVSKGRALVGDALFGAGFAAPLCERRGATEYDDPAAWRLRSDLFHAIAVAEPARVGDLVVLGSAPGHIEMITRSSPVTTLGVRWGRIVEDAEYVERCVRNSVQTDGNFAVVRLRAKLRL